MVFIGHDITQLQVNEFNLQEKVEEQAKINMEQQQLMFSQAKMAAMGEMIGNIAHQWRQPLTVLGLLIQDLEDAKSFGDLDDAYLHGMVEKSMTQIQFMSKTIDDFRNFFQPNKLKERFDMAEMVNKTVDIVGVTLQNHGIRLEYDGIEKGRYLILGYRNEIQQVLLNLMNNAKDAVCAHRGSIGSEVDKWVRISLSGDEASVVLSVEDNGGGIPEPILERVFEPYFTTKEESQGTGVGLYMSKMIIEQNMHGKLEVENHPLGACFKIILPLQYQDEGE